VEVVRWLAEQGQGADLDKQDRDKCTAVCLPSSQGHTPVVRLLLDRGTDPTVVDHKIRTPLIVSSNFDRLETVQCLLDHPSAAATINRRDKRGRTALRFACGVSSVGGSLDVVRALLAKGADPSTIDKDGKTPMIIAQRGKKEPACVEAMKVRCSLPPAFPFTC
jgi:uncharacterized protein